MRTQTALRQPIITNNEVLNLLAQREALDSLKARMARLSESVQAIEASMITRIEDRAFVDSEHSLLVKEVARRYPHWKSHFAALAGAEATERVLADTAPTITKSLVVK